VDPLDPQQRHRSELPPVPRGRERINYRGDWQLEERLQALGVIILGLVGLWLAYAMTTGILPAGLPVPPPPPGVFVPLFNPIACLVPLLVLGAVALIAAGTKRLIDP
jgi:hypothetical protein